MMLSTSGRSVDDPHVWTQLDDALLSLSSRSMEGRQSLGQTSILVRLLNYAGVGLICMFLGSLIGVLVLCILFLTPDIVLVGFIVGCPLAAPVSLLALPIAHYLSRDSENQGRVMLAVGAITGSVSPIPVLMVLVLLLEGSITAPETLSVALFSIVGALSGTLIAPVFIRLMSPSLKIPDEHWTS